MSMKLPVSSLSWLWLVAGVGFVQYFESAFAEQVASNLRLETFLRSFFKSYRSRDQHLTGIIRFQADAPVKWNYLCVRVRSSVRSVQLHERRGLVVDTVPRRALELLQQLQPLRWLAGRHLLRYGPHVCEGSAPDQHESCRNVAGFFECVAAPDYAASRHQRYLRHHSRDGVRHSRPDIPHA